MAKRPSKDYEAFVKLTDRLMAVPRVELQKKLDAHKAKAASNPIRRGPKRKAVTPPDSASLGETDAS
jgi:hypothetical protein